MNAPHRNSARKHSLYRVARPVLLAALCSRSPSSHAYSTGSAPLHRPHATRPPGGIVVDDGGRDDARCNAIGRRAFFRRGTAAIASTAAMATSASLLPPQPANAAAPKIPPLNSPAPDFALINTRGQTVSLDALAADKKWTVLYFYPGAFTSGCTLEARRFQEELPKFQEADAQVVGVSVDGVEKQAEFCTSEGLDFFMLADEGGIVSKAYGSSLKIPGFGTFSNRQTYIIDPQKNVRWVFTDVESHIPKHPNEVLDKLKELQRV